MAIQRSDFVSGGMVKERKKEDKSYCNRDARKKQPKAPAAERSSSVASACLDKDPGSGGHGSSSSRTPGEH